MTQQNQMATIEKTAGDFLKSLQGTLTTYAVRGYPQERFIKSAMIAIVSNEGLQECLGSDEGRASVVNAMRMAAGTGLSLNPQEGKSALIAYSKKSGNKYIKTAQYQVMKNGLIDLALESGKVEFITADTVRDKDEFSVEKTMDGDKYHFAPARKKRGEIDGFFAAIKMKDGTCHVKYMTMDEVSAHRQKFSAKTQMPEEGYGQKTILKKLLNHLYVCPEVDNAVGADNAHEVVEIDPTPENGTSGDELTQKLQENLQEDAPVDAEVIDEEQSEKHENKSKSVI